VVVPFAGDGDGARRAIDALTRIETRPGDELILADNSLGLQAASLDGSTAVRVVPAELERSSYYARNVGAEAAANDWLLFMDADCVPDPRLLDRYFEGAIDARTGILAGGVRPDPAQAAPAARYARARTHITEAPQVRSAHLAAGITPNLLLRRAAYEAVGGFHEGLVSGADVEICWRIQEAGWRLEHHPRASVLHSHVETFAATARQCRRHAAGRAWLNRRYPGAAPRPPLTGRLLHALGGAVYRALRLQGERALFRAVDAWWFCVDSGGYLLGNRASRSRAAAEPPAGLGPLTPTVFLCDSFPALSESFVSSEARELIALGHRVRVESGSRPARPDPLVRREIPADHLEDDGILAKLAGLASLWARHPLRCLADLRDRRRWRREEGIWPLRSLAPVARRIDRGGERHIHAHFAEAAALNALRLGRLLDLPYSVTAHAYDIFKDPRNLAEKLRRASFVTSGCEYNVDHLRGLLGDDASGHVHKVIMGVDGERFRRRRPAPGGRHVVAVGRLVEKKGFGDLIEAAALLARSEPLDRVSIAGEGPQRERLQRLIAERGLTETVSLCGWMNGDRVRELLEQADLLAMPSVVAADGDRDSMPVVVKEALAMEVPVVASEEAGLPEAVQAEWGRLVPPADPQALAGAIAELLALPVGARAEMGRRGREWTLQNASVRAQTEIVSRLIEAAPGTRRLG
jgi:glycosyltransferase involved in cell wall biosynthesis